MLKNLKNLRKEFDLTQNQIAQKLHISQQTYSDYENCKTEPTGEILIEIANLFGVSTDELLGRNEISITEKATGAMLTRKTEITPIEDEMLYIFRKIGKVHGVDAQRALITVAEKMV